MSGQQFPEDEHDPERPVFGPKEPTPERMEHPTMTLEQEFALSRLCDNYGVKFHPGHYIVYSDESAIMPGFAEGWIGGLHHAPPEYGGSKLPTTIYVGCSPTGEIHS